MHVRCWGQGAFCAQLRFYKKKPNKQRKQLFSSLSRCSLMCYFSFKNKSMRFSDLYRVIIYYECFYFANWRPSFDSFVTFHKPLRPHQFNNLPTPVLHCLFHIPAEGNVWSHHPVYPWLLQLKALHWYTFLRAENQLAGLYVNNTVVASLQMQLDYRVSLTQFTKLCEWDWLSCCSRWVTLAYHIFH